MRKAFVVTSALVLLAVIAQFYFAAVSAFTLPHEHNALHATNGLIVIPAIALINTIAASLARAGGRTIGLAALPFLLVILQVVIIVASLLLLPGVETIGEGFGAEVVQQGGPAVYAVGLHAVNGLIILWVTVVTLRRARAHNAATDHNAAPERAVVSASEWP